jgi:hypothetical protein
MNNLTKLAAAIMLAGSPAAAIAQGQPPAPATPEAPVEDEQVTLSRAAKILGLFMGAVQSENIADEEKNGLVACMYGNSLKQISLGTASLLKQNPGLDGNDESVLYAVAATACGARKPTKKPAGEAAE